MAVSAWQLRLLDGRCIAGSISAADAPHAHGFSPRPARRSACAASHVCDHGTGRAGSFSASRWFPWTSGESKSKSTLPRFRLARGVGHLKMFVRSGSLRAQRRAQVQIHAAIGCARAPSRRLAQQIEIDAGSGRPRDSDPRRRWPRPATARLLANRCIIGRDLAAHDDDLFPFAGRSLGATA